MTTIEELRDLVAQSIASTEAFKEKFAATVAASIEAANEATNRRFAEADERRAEEEKRRAEADRTMEELKRQTKEIGKQLGALGNKFGSYTEGLLLPSVEKVLQKEFGITDFYMRLKTKIGAELQELDGFGFVNGKKNIGFIVEVKSHLDKRGIEQALWQVQNFGKFHPQYKGMKVRGIIAAIDTVSETQRKMVYDAGLYLITAEDDIARMPTPPKGFTPLEEIA